MYASSSRDNAPLHTPRGSQPHLSQRVSTSGRTFSRNPCPSAIYCHRHLQHRFQEPITPRKQTTMVKAPPQPPVADAAASSPTMQDRVGPRTTDGHDAKIVPGQQKPTIAAQEISRRDVHTASSINAQRRLPKSGAKEQNSAHRPAITRVNGKEAPRDSPPKSQSTTGSKPVLVRGPSTKSDMKKKHQPMNKSTSPKLPPVESFSFQDILSSIGPEANASIDAIAEICGRSKMSLAAEHKSHRPPQGKLVSTGSSPDTFFLPARLEPVAEMSSNRPHTRSMSRSLALTTGSAYSGDGLPSDPTAATSNVTSHTHTSTCRHGKGEGSTSTSASLLPQVLAWLLRSRSTTTNEQPSASDHDAGAISAMHRLLNDTSEAPL